MLAHLTLVTLTFDPKINRFLCCPGRMCGPILRKVGQGVLELLIGNSFGTFDPGDLDLWPSDSNITRVPLLVRTDVWTKFKKGRVKGFSIYWLETVLAHLTLVTFDPVTPKSIGFLCCPGRCVDKVWGR